VTAERHKDREDKTRQDRGLSFSEQSLYVATSWIKYRC